MPYGLLFILNIWDRNILIGNIYWRSNFRLIVFYEIKHDKCNITIGDDLYDKRCLVDDVYACFPTVMLHTT